MKTRLHIHSDRKCLGAILIIICLLCTHINVSAQKIDTKFNEDSSKTITLTEFNHRVNRATELLKTKKLSAISDTDHINIMMCLNTLFMDRIPSFDQVFKGGKYEELEKVEKEKKYSRDILKVYPECVPNRGMGLYLKKLKMELYGTPLPYAIFNVVK